MEFDPRNPYRSGTNASQGGGGAAGGAGTPGKMSLSEALGSASGGEAAVDSDAEILERKRAAAARQGAPLEQVFGTDTTAKQEAAHTKPKAVPRLDLGKRGGADAGPAGAKHAAAGPAAAAPKSASTPAASAKTAAPAAAPGKTTAPGAAHAAPPAAHAPDGKAHGGEGRAAKHGGEGGPGGATPQAGGNAGAADPKANAQITVEVARTAAGNPSKSRTSVGIGEQVTFSSKADGEWTAAGASLGSGTSASWTAPDTAGSVEIAHTAKGSTQKQTMNVVAPASVEFESKGGFPVKPAGVGMTTKVKVGPTNVSFGACEWLEEPGPADGTSGYFSAYVAAGKGDLAHHPNKTWLGMGDSNDGVEDHAWTSDNPPLLDPDKKEVGYFQGAFGWNIPNKYRVAGKGDGTTFTTVRQQFNMSPDGSVSVTKGAASATQAGDGRVQGSMEKCTTIGQAHAMLNRQGSRVAALMFVLQYNASGDKDPETQRLLIAALREENIKFYVHVHCDNTYNWFSRDQLAFSVKGTKGSYSESFLINSKKNKEITFSIEQLIDYNSGGIPPIIIRADNEDGKMAFSTVMNQFEALKEVDAGSGGHYQISAHVQ